MFACIAKWPPAGTVRTSFHPTLRGAIDRAEHNLGVIAIEELGVGVVWRRDAEWFSTSSGRIELQLTLEEAASVSHQGQCDADVAALRQVPAVRAQLDKLDRALVAAELEEYGAWDDQELQDHDANLSRLLWLAGCDITEEHNNAT